MAQTNGNPLGETKGDQWNDMADDYQKLTTDTSMRPIGVMLERANALHPFSEATGLLDNGCGPGPVMTRLLKDYRIPDSCSITCSDFSEGMIKQVQKRKDQEVQANISSPWSRVETVVQNAMDLKSIEDSSKSHVTAGWVYFMTQDPQKCLSESRRVLKDGGVLTCSSWEGSEWMDLMNLFPRIKPDKNKFEVSKEWSTAGPMKAELEKAGFKDVESYQVPTTMKFEKLEDLVAVFFTKMPHLVALMKEFSEDEQARLKALTMEEARKLAPNDPGELNGTALVAVGRK